MAPADTAQLKIAVRNWSLQVLAAGTEAMPDQMRPYAPIGKPTRRDDGYEPGELRESIQVVQTTADLGTTFSRRMIAPVIQAQTTDQGAPPHIIRSRRSHGLLVFEIGDQTIITSKPVNHPGNRAKPWWLRALNATWGPNLRFAALHTRFGSPR